MDFNERPFIAIWEVTQACDLACAHCRACAKPLRHPLELSTAEGQKLIDEIAEMRVPVFVLTGGDPLKRPDIYKLVEYATLRGVRASLSPSATPLLTRQAVAELQRRGLARLAVSLDGSNAEIHDAFRGVSGSYDRTVDAVRWARELDLPVQINTTVTRRNLADFDATVRRLETLDIVLWSVFFLVPTGRGQADDLITAEEFEEVFAKLHGISRRVPFDIKTTEAQHYRRYLAQARGRSGRVGATERRQVFSTATTGARPIPKTPDVPPGRPPRDMAAGVLPAASSDGIGRAPRGVNNAKGFVFISHLGEVFPSGFLPLSAGNVRHQSLADIYRNSPLFVALRDASRLKGKCGVCEFRQICGGSRARAYALTGDPFAEEPCCVYQPQTARVAA
ncbi:MAG: TIGR04053 family radical SAM/SPASM domain-containing protein [Acidobacteria bacterium]|nr:TIGR04053 family radical SAM/SPASM domain-containing protein [Acidobacteriota bacterium]